MSATAHKQTLLLFKGHPATGKSTLANALACALQWPLIDKDDIKDHIEHLPHGGHLSYQIMWQIVRHQLALGLSVIVDSPLSYPHLYATGVELAAEHTSRVIVVETKLDESHWRARLEARRHQPPNHRTAGWESMQALLATYDGSWQYPIAPASHLVVETTEPTAHLVQTIIRFLEADA